MTKIDRNIVEQEVSQMFDEHKTIQGVVEALLVESGWDANAIRANQEARQKKQEAEAERQEKKKKKKEEPQKLIQRLGEEQKAEQIEDEKSSRGSRRTLPLVTTVEEKEVEFDEESETEAEEEEEKDEESLNVTPQSKIRPGQMRSPR